MHPLARLDHRYLWHPFTQMRDWLRGEPIVIASGKGAVLRDVRGREHLDANSSIWTNLHGHNHPVLNAAIQRQLKKIAHSSALGLGSGPASQLGAQLVEMANREDIGSSITTGLGAKPNRMSTKRRAGKREPHLAKVFFSDNGSTAVEVALKLAYEFARRTRGDRNPRFLSLAGAYHGDTVGAVSLGHIDLFHKAYAGLLFKSDAVMAPYCYRCPFNRAKPERADARTYRKCNWECVGKVEQKLAGRAGRGRPYAGFVFEPLMQGAAGMIPQPSGWLKRVTDIARGHGALLIADEVMTGFGRAVETGRTTNQPTRQMVRDPAGARLFACTSAGIEPDFLCLAKGLTGGYLPMAATLTSQAVFDAFLGEYQEFKTFFHGHSYTGNQLGAAAALANLKILRSISSVRARARLQRTMASEVQRLWSRPQVGDIRQVGLVVGVELVRHWHARKPFDLREKAGIRVAEAMARRGVLTRPIGSVIVLMPPYCTTPAQVRRMVESLDEAIVEVFGESKI